MGNDRKHLFRFGIICGAALSLSACSVFRQFDIDSRLKSWRQDREAAFSANESGNTALAETLYREALKEIEGLPGQESSEVMTRRELAEISIRQKKDADVRTQCLAIINLTATDTAPNIMRAEAMLWLAQILEREGKDEEARQAYQNAHDYSSRRMNRTGSKARQNIRHEYQAFVERKIEKLQKAKADTTVYEKLRERLESEDIVDNPSKFKRDGVRRGKELPAED